MKPEYTAKRKEECIKLLSENLGLITPVLKKMKLSHKTYRKWLDVDEDFRTEVEGIGEETLDFVENKLYSLIKQNDKTAIIFYLKTKGQRRGYIEKQQIDQSITYTEPLTLNVIAPTQEPDLLDEPKERLN